jgi:hypothetical protein
MRRPLRQAEPDTKPDTKPNDGLGVIAHAYALVWTPQGHISVHLQNVRAEQVEYLEPNGRPELRRLASARVGNAIDKRKVWGTP